MLELTEEIPNEGILGVSSRVFLINLKTAAKAEATKKTELLRAVRS